MLNFPHTHIECKMILSQKIHSDKSLTHLEDFLSQVHFSSQDYLSSVQKILKELPLSAEFSLCQGIPIAEIGPSQSHNHLIVSAGLHGVEGRFGTLLCAAFLKSLLESDLKQSKLTIIFALNLDQMAQCRRWGPTNADLNRSFPSALISEVSPTFEGIWQKLYQEFGPHQPKIVNLLRFIQTALQLIRQQGLNPLVQTLPQGQERFADFVFYREKQLTKQVQHIQECMIYLVKPHQRTLHIDLHTGFGPWAKLQSLTPVGPLAKALGREAQVYPTPGGFLDWCQNQFSKHPYQSTTAEFGTSIPISIFYALLAENHNHHKRDSSPDTQKRLLSSQAKVLNAFFPKSPRWRRKALREGILFLQEALSKLGEDGSPLVPKL